ncbi:MAG: hypothetical protein DMF03_00360 [Verrucomicrobia bacterium]|nr:MAG: hypothetical protein DMF03_00360 [Verrucomicrobiota bacterium]
MMKIIAAVIAGLITWILVATAVNLLLRILWRHYHEAEIGFNFTLGMMIARLTLGAVSSICGGFVVAWIAKANSAAVKVTGLALLVLFVPNHYLLWHKFPVWYHLTFLVSLFPLTMLGAILKARRTGR